MAPTVDEIRQRLGLTERTTCGYVRETYRSGAVISQSALPPGYDGPRPLGNVLYFLVTPEAPVRLHANRSDQMYHHYFGETLEVLLLHVDGRSDTALVGCDWERGAKPQLFIPGGTFHAARVDSRLGAAGFSLLGTSVWLRAEPSDITLIPAEELTSRYPEAADLIAAFCD